MTLDPRFMHNSFRKQVPFQGQTLRLRKTLFQPRQKTSSDHRRQRPEMSTLAIYSRDNGEYNP